MNKKLFQVKNVDADLIDKYSKFCLNEGVTQRFYLEKWLEKLLK